MLYNAVALFAILVSAPGCGDPKPAPPGAPEDTSAPAIDSGEKSGAPTEPQGDPNHPSASGSKPQGE